jgi:hypothetical protein
MKTDEYRRKGHEGGPEKATSGERRILKVTRLKVARLRS